MTKRGSKLATAAGLFLALPAPRTGTLTEANLIPQPDLGINTFEDAVGALLQGDTYVNVHTETHENGEIRGQVSLL